MKIVKLSATWCMPCKALSQTLKQIQSDEMYKDINIVEYDVENDEEGQRLAMENRVSSVPTMLFYDDSDNIVMKMIGNVPRKDIETAIQKKLLSPKEEKKDEE